MSMHYARIAEALPGIYGLALLDGTEVVAETFNPDRTKLEALAAWWENSV